MNIRTKLFNPNKSFPLPEEESLAGTNVLDIETSGRYWRNSQITSLSLMRPRGNHWVEKIYLPEKEADEYDLLVQLIVDLKEVEEILTFNGTTFDLPYLKNKLKAYGLMDPFAGKKHRDLMKECRPLSLLLQLPSYRLDDFRAYMGMPEADDAQATLNLLSLAPYLSLFRGGYTYGSASADDTHLYYHLTLPCAVPKTASMQDGPYHLILNGENADISVLLYDGRLRRYYTDVENYEYLPAEGCAIHKSLAACVEKSRREKAVRENCFTYVKFDLSDPANEKRLKEYLSAVLTYLAFPFTR